MESITSLLRWYFVEKTGWMSVTAMVVAAYVFTQASDNEMEVAFLRFLASLSLISAPILVYTQLRPGWQLPPNWWAWAAVFVVFCGGILVYGPGLQQLPFTRYYLESDSQFNQQGVRFLFLLFLGIEAIHSWRSWRGEVRFSYGWLRRVSIPWLGVGFVAVVSLVILFSSNYVQEAARPLGLMEMTFWGSGVYLQLLIVYLPYYLIYHVNHYYLFRILLQKHGVLVYLIGAVGFLLTFTLLHTFFIRQLPAIMTYQLHPVAFAGAKMSDLFVGLSAWVLMLTLPFILLVEWFKKEESINRLQAEKTATELLLLKEQINPHFFFNTLNNLYAMSLTQEARTSETILQLSELMRYVIYKGKEDTVSISDEVKYLKDYLDLQSIRLHKQLDLRFEVSLADEATRVPPLLFIILVENAFKHGVEPAEEDCFLHLQLTADASGISFHCNNSVAPTYRPPKSPGIGLLNLRRRLEHLFPGRYELRLEAKQKSYQATLQLQAEG